MRRKRAGKKSYLFFIDLKKAFDTVWWDGLLRAVHDVGIRGKAWRIIRSVYSDIQVSTLVDGHPSRWVQATVGVRQGCPLSPVLFNIYINSLATKLEELAETHGVQIVGSWLDALMYADDVVAISGSREGLQALMDEVDVWCRKWRCKVNLGKSKVMVVLPPKPKGAAPDGDEEQNEEVFLYRGERVEKVAEYRYLGVIIHESLLWKRQADRNIGKARSALNKVARLLTRKGLGLRAKKLIYCALVRPHLEYGCEVVSLNSSEANRMESIQHRALTKILSLNSKAGKHCVNAMVDLTSIVSRRRYLRLKFLRNMVLSDKHSVTGSVICRLEDEPRSRIRGRTQLGLWARVKKPLKPLAPGEAAHMEGLSDQLDEVAQLADQVRLDNPNISLLSSLEQLRSQVRNGVLPITAAGGSLGRLYVAVTAFDVELEEFRTWRDERHLDEADLAHVLRGMRPRCGTVPRAATGAALRESVADKIRARMVCGTHSLNSIKARIRESRTDDDCFGNCPFHKGIEESVLHFTVQCSAYGDARQEMIQNLEFHYQNWSELDPETQCRIILGGPVSGESRSMDNGWQTADAACRVFIKEAWEQRSAELERNREPTDSESSEDEDDGPEDLAQRPISDFFQKAPRADQGPQAGRSANSMYSMNADHQASNGSNEQDQENVDISNGGRNSTLIGARRRRNDEEAEGVRGLKRRRVLATRGKRNRRVERRGSVRMKKMRRESVAHALASSPAHNTLFRIVSKTERSLEPETWFRPLNPRGERLPMLAPRSQEPP